jgi:hypothetical protein
MIPILVSHGLTPASHPLLALMRLYQSHLIDQISMPTANLDSNAPAPSTQILFDAQERLDKAVRVAAQASAGLDAVLCEGHPVRAIALAELGKLLAVDEPALPTSAMRPPASSDPGDQTGLGTVGSFPPHGPARLRLAHDTLQRALKELRIGFGSENEGGEVGKDVREQIVGLEKEMGVWRQGVRDALEHAPMPQT